MALWNSLSGAGRAVVCLGAAALAVAGYFALKPVEEPAPVEVAVVEPVPEVAPVTAVEPKPEPEAEAQVMAEELAPRFDVVRIAPDGATTVAGSAGPATSVTVLLNGEEITAVTADQQGKFAALFTLPPSDKVRELSLQATWPEGAMQLGPEIVALAPIAAPAVAGAEQAVAQPEAPVVLLLDAGKVKILQSAEAEPVAAVADVLIDAITYTAEGDVRLGGTAQAGGNLRIYLDQAFVGDVVVGADGVWQRVLGEVASGIYTLRVDQIDAAGKVLSRFETPFKRESLQALAEVALLAKAMPIPEAVPVLEVTAAPEMAVEPVPAAPASAPVPVAEPEPTAKPTPKPMSEPVKAAVTITVQPGYSLWSIAKAEFGEGVMYVQVFEANKDRIKDPDLIYPGQVFALPAP